MSTLAKREVTVEEALKELREMLGPLPSFQISCYVQGDETQWRISSVKLPNTGGTSLGECLDQIRKWRKGIN